MWVDMHTHLPMLEVPVADSIKEAQKAGVQLMVTVATHPEEDHQVVLDISRAHYPTVFCTLGVHPYDAVLGTSCVYEKMREQAADKGVIAIGEIGLDYHRKSSPIDVQQQAFEAQMQLAADLGLPVQIHTREAEKDTVAILKSFPQVKGMIHCFTGSQWLADQVLALGYNLSFSGVVTFQKAEDLRSVARNTPISRIFVETDAPFLTPHPLRGKKNHPAYVAHTGALLAQLKGVSVEDFQEQVMQNALQMFSKLLRPKC